MSGSTRGADRLQVPQGADACEFLCQWVERQGLKTAAFQFLHGTIQSLELMTGKPDIDRGRVATFHGPHIVRCPAQVLGCHGVIGVASPGHRIHAHGVFVDAHGQPRGCHLIPSRCIAGIGGLVVAVYPIGNAHLQVLPDPETGFDLLFPVEDSGDPPGGSA